jgi:hypothetical protein
MSASLSPVRPRPSHDASSSLRLLRAILGVDAITSGLLGSALLAAPGPAARLVGLPAAALVEAGIVLVVFAAAVGWTALGRVPRKLAVLAIVDVNVLWTIASLVAAIDVVDPGAPFGRTLVLTQALAVLAIAVVEFVLLRRSTRG